jgi:hypothetical protein
MRILANLNVVGTLDLDSVANAGVDTDRFLVQDSNGVVRYRTGAEVASDIGASNLAASVLKHQVKLGEAIAKGQAVYVSSSDGTNMIVSKASNASEATSSKTLGLLETGGALNAQVNVITEGLLAGLDTSTAVAGDPVWLGTNGNLIFGLANKPYAPAHLVFVGIVTRVQQNNGEIFIKPQNGFELREIHDVQITTTPNNNEVLSYETSSSLYKMKSIPTLLGYTPADSARILTINGTAYDLSANRTWNVGTVTSVGLSVPTGFAIGSSPVTGSGTLALSFAAGYSLPTTASQSNWDTAYSNRITSLTTTGTSGAATLSSNVLNIPNYTLAGLGGVSGSGTTNTLPKFSSSTGLTDSIIREVSGSRLLIGAGTVDDTTSIIQTNGEIRAVHLTLSGAVSNNTNLWIKSVTGFLGQIIYMNNSNMTFALRDNATYWDVYSYVTGSAGQKLIVYASGTVKLPGYTLNGFLKTSASDGTLVVDTNTYLTGNQSITLSGDATGSGTTSIAVTLSNSGVTAGTYRSVTVDSKGRVTAGTNPTTISGYGITDAYTKTEINNFFSGTTAITGYNKSNWDTAFGWGNHASQGYATTSYVTTQINNLVAGAPGLLDTLDELAAALGDDPNFATTVTTALSNRLRVDTATQGLTSTQQSNGRTNLGLGSLATLSSIGNAYITDLAWSKITGAPSFLTAEADTLASVTGRGATTSSAVTFNAGITVNGTAHSIFNKPSTSAYQTVSLFGTSGGGVFITSDNAIVGRGAYYNSGWIATATSGAALDFTSISGGVGIFYFTGATVGGAPTMSATYTLYHTGNLTNLNQLTNGPGYITGNQNITLSGDVTGSGATSIVTTIANNAVTTSKINNGAVTAAKLATFGAGEGIYWSANTDGASILFESTGDGASGGRALSNLVIALSDNGDEGLKVTSAGTELFYVNTNQIQYKGTQLVYNSGTWGINITGNAATLGGYGPNQTGGAYTIVQRDANGYIQNSYFYMSGGGSERNSSGLGYIAGFNSSDYYVRSYNSTAVASFLGLGSMAYQNTGSYYTTSNSIYTNAGNFTTAGTGWYRVATTGSDGRGTYYVEVYTTGGNHNPSYLKILAHGDWGNDKLVTVETDGGFPASAVRITRGASNTFLEVYFTTTILGASLRVNRLGFDSSVQIYTGALPSGGDTLKDQLPVDSKFITQSISATSRIYVGNGGETLGLIGMGASNLYGLGISGAYTSLYGHFQGNGVQLGYYNGSSFTPRLIVNNGGDIVLTSGTSGTTGKLIFKTTDNSDLNKYIMQDGYWTIIGTHSNEGLRVRDSGGNILINIAGSTNGYPSRVGIGTTTPSYKLHVAGDIYADGGWMRISGTAGLYWETYGGGFRMTGSSYVEMYNNKSLHMQYGSVDYVGSMYLESGGQGVHLQPNTSGSYGALQITSSRNGWPGIYFTVAGTSLMVNSNESGFYRQGYGWQMRWENGTGYVNKNGQGGGTSATILDTSNYTTWAQPKVYMGQSDGNWQNFTNDVGEFRVDEVLNITSGAHSNYPPNVYTYGGVLSWRLNNHSFQLYASHTGDLTFKTQWGNDNYSGWRRILHESNYNSYSPTLTGGGASGTWGISITGSAASATNATNLYGAGGSYIQSTSTGTSYTANYQVRENSGGGGSTNEIYAPQLAFHWSGVVASSIMMESSGRIAIRNNPGSAYESFIAYDVYGSNSMRAPQFRFTNSSNNAYLTGNSDWGFRVVNDNGYIQFGPANGSWSHIYSDKSFYFNQELYVNNNQVIHPGNTSGVLGAKYQISDTWLRVNSDNRQFQMYGNSRTMIYRTDGNTNEHGGGGYAHIFYYGGSADGDRRMIINTDGTIWSSNYGWLSDAFASKSTTHVINAQYNATISTDGWYTIASYGSGRALATFHIFDTDSSRHNYAEVKVNWSYGYGGITVVNNGRHGSSTIKHVRLLYNTSDQTYGGVKIQVYCENSTFVLRIRQEYPNDISGWGSFSQVSPTLENSPSGWAEYTRAHNVNERGVITTSNSTGYLGGNVIWHQGNLTNLNQLTNGPGYITSSSLSGYVPYGNWSQSTGMNDSKLYFRTNGDNNHYLWNANDDWEELVYYTGTGFRIKGSTGTTSATFTDSGLSILGNTALHAGNYNSYALPLSGGTVTGATTFSSNVNANGTYLNVGGYIDLSGVLYLRSNVNYLNASSNGWNTFLSRNGEGFDAYVTRVFSSSHISSTGGNLHTNRGRLAFSSTAGDANHTIYNNYNNIDGEGSWDGMKMNVYNGLDVRTGAFNASTTVLQVRPTGISVNSLKVGFRNGGATEFIQGEGWTMGIYGYNSNDGFLFYQRDTTDAAHPCFHIGGWNNASYGGYSTGDSMVTLVRGDGSKSEGSTYADKGLSNSSYYTNIIKTSSETVLRDAQGRHKFTGRIILGTFPNSTTNTGEAWIGRASDRNAGTMTVQLGGSSASGRQFEVVDYAWSVVLFNVSSAGNVTASADMRAPIYYDSQNTAYYLDPNSTTSIRTVGSWRADSANWDGEFAGKIQYHSNSWYLQANSYWYFRNAGGANVTQIDSNGNISTNGSITVGSGLNSSDIFMNDGDEGTRRIHCNSNRIGFLTQSANWGAYCDDDGNWTAVGDITAYSDARVKENVKTVENALDKTLKMRGVTFTRNDIEDKSTKIGVIAQEVMEVLPEVVKKADDGMYNVSYGNIVGVLIEAIKEQQKQIDDLKSQINGTSK